jgi:RNA polymerase sigma-70 factor (ECF subfamily)
MNHQAAAASEPWPVVSPSGQIAPDQASFDDKLAAALQELSDEARSCLLLRIVEQLSYAEISALLNIPEGTAMSHVHRSKAALRKRLADGPEKSDPTADAAAKKM